MLRWISRFLPFACLCLLSLPAAAVPGLAYNNFFNPNHSEVDSMVADSSGNVYVAASTSPYAGLIVAKYDPLGNPLWTKTYDPGAQTGSALGIALDSKNNVFICGATGLIGNTDAVVVKYSTTGTFLWDQRYNGLANANDEFNGIVVDGFDNPIAVGDTDDGGSTGVDALLMKLDTSNGLPIFIKTLDGSDSSGISTDVGALIRMGPNNVIYMSGNSDFVDMTTDPPTHNQHVFVDQFPDDGSSHRVNFLTSGSSDFVEGMGVGASGSVYVLAQSLFSGNQMTLEKYDSGLNTQWTRTYGPGSDNFPTNLAVNPIDESVVIVGYSVLVNSNAASGAIFTSGGDQRAKLEASFMPVNSNAANLARVRCDVNGAVYLVARGGTDASHFQRVLKLNPDGTLIWQIDYSTNNPHLKTMALGATGDVYVGGFSDASGLGWLAKFNQVVANNDGPYNTPADTILNVDAAHGVLANDLYVTPSTTLGITANATNGLLQLNSDGSFSYNPHTDFVGPDSFTYSLSKQGVTATATVSLNVKNSIKSLTFNPTSVAGGSSSTATVTMTAPPSSGSGAQTVNLGYGDSVVSGPSSVSVPVGSRTATFTVDTTPVSTSGVHTVNATFNATTVSAGLTVTTQGISSFSVSPTSVAGGSGASGSVTLISAAGSGGVTITLSTNLSSATLSTQSLVIPQGSTSGSFTITTVPVSVTQKGTVSATFSGKTSTTPFTVRAPLLQPVVLSAGGTVGGRPITATISLTGKIPSGGAKVTLAYGVNASGPSIVTVGSTGSAAVTVRTTQVTSAVSSFVRATFDNVVQSKSFNIVPYVLTAVAVSPPSIYGTRDATGKVTLNGLAPSGGLDVALTVPSGLVAPTSVHIAPGVASATFLIETKAVTANLSRTITAKFRTYTKTVTVTLRPLPVSSLKLASSSVKGGTSVTGTVTLGVGVGRFGAFVQLRSSDTTHLTVPSQVAVAPGKSSATFTATTKAVSANTVVTVTGSIGSSSASGSVTLTK